MKFKLIYGNYGSSATPFHPPMYLMDIFTLIKLGLESAGHVVDFEHSPCPGKTNILLENFTYDFLETCRTCRKTPGTEFIVVATDFITGDTFNDFGDPEVERDAPSIYENRDYWQKRYRTFIALAEMAQAVWNLNADQIDVYRRRLGHDKVHYLPHGYLPAFRRVKHRPFAEKDIDVFFSGSLTPYRNQMLQHLSRQGLQVQALPSTTNPVIRDDLLARSKIALNLKQHPRWQFPSTSRFHYHLCNASPLLSEQCAETCDLTPYVRQVTADQLLDTLRETLRTDTCYETAMDQHERFAREMPLTPLIHTLLSSTYPG